MAAMLSAEIGNAEKVAHFIDASLAMDIVVLGPDVNESRGMFTPVFRRAGAPAGKEAGSQESGVRSQEAESGNQLSGAAQDSPETGIENRESKIENSTAPSGAIRFGLAGIKGVGEVAALKIIEEREANGPYRDFADFMVRVDLRAINKRVVECLVLTGAFDFSGATRAELFDQVDAAIAALGELQRKYPALRREDPGAVANAVKEAPDAMLFDMAEHMAPATPPPRDQLIAEFSAMMRVSQARRPAPTPVAPSSLPRRPPPACLTWVRARLLRPPISAPPRPPHPRRKYVSSMNPRCSSTRRSCWASTSRATRWMPMSGSRRRSILTLPRTS